MSERHPITAQLTLDDLRLHRRLGYWSLVAMGIGSVIGSGWLFAAMYAAQAAGPASIVAWLIGGAIMLALALVTAELGITHPESGGLSRYPLYSNGRLAAGLIGWCGVIAVIGIPALEAAGVLQYAGSYIPGLFDGGTLTPLGILCAAVLLAVFTLLNYFGVKLFSESNNIVTFIKVFIPVLAIAAFILSGFTGNGGAGGVSNLTAEGFAPYGLDAALSIIATGGILFSFNGASVIITVSGEVRNPRRTIPQAMITTIVFCLVLYMGMQMAFLFGVPVDTLAATGWRGVNFDSPFASLALILGIQWLYWILIADAAISPSGAAIIGVGSNARNMFALAKNRFLPGWIQSIDQKWGVPRRALVVTYMIGLAFLLPLPSWHAIISIVGILGALTFGVASVSASVFRRTGVTKPDTRIPGVGFLAPLTFAAGGMVVSWVKWEVIAPTIPLLAIGVLWYAVTFAKQKHGRTDLQGGLWLLLFFAFLYLTCYAGSFGIGIIPAPLDTIVVAAGSLLFYWWGVFEGVRYMRRHPEIGQSMCAETEQPAFS